MFRFHSVSENLQNLEKVEYFGKVREILKSPGKLNGKLGGQENLICLTQGFSSSLEYKYILFA